MSPRRSVRATPSHRGTQGVLVPGPLAPALVSALMGLSAAGPARADPPSWLDRGVVAVVARRAVEHAGLGGEVTRDLSSRARAAGWVPRFSARVARGAGSSLTYQSGVDRGNTDDSLVLDFRVSFDLDRVVFAPSEVGIARVELARSARRSVLEREAVDLLAAMERARLTLARAVLDDAARVDATLDLGRSRARLDALVGADLRDVLHERSTPATER